MGRERGFLGWGSKPHQLGGLGSTVSSPAGKFGFWSILGYQKLRQNGQLAFESGRATSESGRHMPPRPNVELTLPELLTRLSCTTMSAIKHIQ